MRDKTSKSKWKTFKFGDVVRQIKDRVTDIENCGLTEYTRGEHFESENLHLIGRSKIGDGQHGSAFHMRFRPGDVLYVSRNPQLRKVAVADYDGICANTSYVFRADGENLIQELLPFIMQKEDFVEYTIQHKRGSTNFYLNPSDIEPYEFPLPPVDEQRRIADLLWAADDLKTNYQLLLNSAITLQSSVLQDSFGNKTELVDLEQWCRNIITYGIVQAGPHIEDGIPYIRVSDMTSNEELSIDGMLRTTKAIAEKYKRSEVCSGDIVVALRGPVGLVRTVTPELNGANLTQGTARVSVKDDFVRDYVFWALRSPVVIQQYGKYSKGSTFSEISLQALRGIKIPMCPIDEQKKIADKMNEVSESIKTINKSIEAANIMTRQLLSNALS